MHLTEVLFHVKQFGKASSGVFQNPFFYQHTYHHPPVFKKISAAFSFNKILQFSLRFTYLELHTSKLVSEDVQPNGALAGLTNVP